MKYRYFAVLLFLFPLLAQATLPDLTYSDATANSKLKHQPYDKLEVFEKGKGYVPYYGETWAQGFKHPQKLGDDHETLLKAFFAQQFGFDVSLFQNKSSYARYEQNGEAYLLKLDSYVASYSYTLLRIAPWPKLVTLPAKPPYLGEKRGKTFDLPEHPLIPEIKGMGIRRATFHDYDEVDFRYDRKAHTHKGRFWKIDYARLRGHPDSIRYSATHDYKAQAIAQGAQILKDKDYDFTFSLNGAVAQVGCDTSQCSIKIIQEEAFKQALILTPDAIKAELDKAGKITLDGIYFDFDKATLKAKSRKAILSAVALMQRYADLELSIHGYTDSKGNDDYNRKLSLNRAKAVMEAMIQQGVAAKRLSYKGHGEDEPVASNDTDEGRAQNRRVELHKERGGNKQSVITIDFIKPIENSVIEGHRRYEDDSLGLSYTPPYSGQKEYREFKGHLEVIDYTIMKEGKKDSAFSRKAIIKNYANVLELYNAKTVGNKDHALSFEIPDRGDGLHIYGRIDAYDGSYSIRFLLEGK